jgi:4-aminobutyrate aminotransferase
MPIGVCTAKADIMDWHKGAHASTFGGNPVALASALKTIELLQGGLVDNAREVGAYLEAGLNRLKEKIRCHRRCPRFGDDARRRICDRQENSRTGS